MCFFACGYSVVLVPSVKMLRCFKDKIWGLKSCGDGLFGKVLTREARRPKFRVAASMNLQSPHSKR